MSADKPAAEDALVELAGAIADRTPVDWDDAAARTPELAPGLARLREIEAIREAMTRAGDAAPSDVLFTWGPLQALARIGEGSFAEVFRAWDPQLQREVALKLRRMDLGTPALGGRRWIEEARKLARVRHPHVLAVLGADEHDDRAGLWTELVNGVTLEDWIAVQGPLGPREAAAVGVDLCQALAAVHAAGLLHADVTLRNVMREGRAGAADRSGRVVLMDFGSAQDAAAGDFAAFGTPAFLAPEVLEGEAPGVQADVYSLGVVLYRLLTARYPVALGSIGEMRDRLARGERTPLREARPDLPAALVAAIERACAPKLDERFASAAELEQALAVAVAAPSPPAAAATPHARRRTTLALTAALAVAAAAIALFAWLRPPAPPRSVAQAEGAAGAPAPAAPAAAASAPVAAAPERAVASEPPGVEATLYRVTGGARQSLRNGDLVAPGDELELDLTSEEPVHVYVLSEDEAGAVFVLFPLEGRGARNPVAAGATQRLPGRDGDRDLSWQVTSAGGRETFLVLASRTPLAPVQEALAALPHAAPDAAVAYRTLSPEALARLRGVGGVVRSEPLQSSGAASMLPALARDLAASREGRAIWRRLLVLENPAP